ncbi:geranylgeranyl reductase family protein [Luedemannella helvata]|uniref:Geranylgeranyl reductase family protein n=1 Tax=Luedemannella helvata TaxID=349315 RepID=A0ABN2L1D8_9ACTN
MGEGAWDVVVVGAGPAGLSAAHAAAGAGARTLVLERAEHPRYKTCGGGLIGTSLAALPAGFAVPARDVVRRVTFTHAGRAAVTRTCTQPLVSMVARAEFDDALRAAAASAGAEVRQRVTVRALHETPEGVRVELGDGTAVTGRVVVGADGSGGVTSRHVGVAYSQVDLGLEVELPVAADVREAWRGRLLIDWGPLPGSYGWVFPKDDYLTVGVIAARGSGAETKDYLASFVGQLGLSGIAPLHDSGHLTRCRTDDSPLRRGRVLVAGDAAGLLEPWTREGISFALRSGALAGAAAARDDLDGYERAVAETLVPTMRAGREILRAFTARPRLFHRVVSTRPGWRAFEGFCRGTQTPDDWLRRRAVRAGLALLTR